MSAVRKKRFQPFVLLLGAFSAAGCLDHYEGEGEGEEAFVASDELINAESADQEYVATDKVDEPVAEEYFPGQVSTQLDISTVYTQVAVAEPQVATNPAVFSAGTSSIVDPTSVGPDELLGIVQVFSSSASCTGMLIADDRVLTAAHCFCTTDWVGSNACEAYAQVRFRQDPNGLPVSDSLRTMAGSVTVHPNYNPSWVDSEFENDLAVIDLISTAPPHVTRFKLAETNPPSGTQVRIAGYGRTGNDCDGSSGTLNQDLVCISEYTDDSKIMQFNDRVSCEGDSGGPVLNLAGDTIYGVNSSYSPTLSHGLVSKKIAVAPYHSWIKGLTCSSGLDEHCDDKGPLCRCKQGVGDCDTDADCRQDLECAEDVGATFGYPADTDVCVAPGPLEGSCGCGNSGLGNLCIPSYNACSAGFAAKCTPTMGSGGVGCGVCSCE